jgi:hypothetical protein
LIQNYGIASCAFTPILFFAGPKSIARQPGPRAALAGTESMDTFAATIFARPPEGNAGCKMDK